MGQVVPSDMARQMLPGLRTEFLKQYKGVPNNYQQVSLIVPSTKLEESYSWLGNLPKLRKFGAERMPKGLSEFGFKIKNEKWEASVRVDNDLFRFEQYGQVKALVGGLGVTIPQGKNELVNTLLGQAFSTPCYDGQFMVDTDHQEGSSGAQSNKLTLPLTPENFGIARAVGRKFKDDQGKLVGNFYGPMILMVPPELETTALKITDAATVVEGGVAVENIWKGKAQTVVNPYLTDADNWFLIDVATYSKPIILQEVGQSNTVDIVTDTRGGDDDFNRDYVSFGTPVTHFNAGFGDWRSIVGSQV
jgi:phage major head subunit gpT-like protein